MADNIIDKVRHFRVKWVSINHKGNTWEPRKHFIGEKAERLVETYLAQKIANQAAKEQGQKDMLEGRLVET